ncbi:MAG: hypothetical protein ACLFWG_08115, partial [Longimicrobiales bacterium]
MTPARLTVAPLVTRVVRTLVVPILVVPLLSGCGPDAEDTAGPDAPTLRTVSTTPTRVSGGDVLVAIGHPSPPDAPEAEAGDVSTSPSGSEGARPTSGLPLPTVLLNGENVTASFGRDPDRPGRWLG